MPSIASSLPRKTESSGTAAASTSMILFDFSSTRVESDKVASMIVTEKIRVWPSRASIRRSIWRLPAAFSVTSRTTGWPCTRAPAASSAAVRLASSTTSCNAPAGELVDPLRAGQHRPIERAAEHGGIAALPRRRAGRAPGPVHSPPGSTTLKSGKAVSELAATSRVRDTFRASAVALSVTRATTG